MKKNYLFKNTSRLFILMGIAATTWLSSCKDTSPGSVNFADSPALVGFQYYGFNAVPIQTKIHGVAGDSTKVEVTLSVHSIILKSPVTVTVATDAADGASYAAAQTAAGDTTYVVPTSTYSIANGGNLTIAPGQQIVQLKMAIKGNLVDFSNPDYTYIIPLKIVSASGAIIATNLNVAYLQLTLQSIFEGHYTATGTIVDATSSAINGIGVYPESIDLLTDGSAYTVEFVDKSFNEGTAHPINTDGTGPFSLSAYGVFDPVFTFNTGGQVTGVTNLYGQGTNSRVRAAILGPGANTYSGTPGTSGFKAQVSYIMTQSGAPRTTFTETYVYDGPAI